MGPLTPDDPGDIVAAMTVPARSSADAAAALVRAGVEIPAPEQIYIAADVDLDRIAPGVTLYPGTRLHGARTYLGPRSVVGSEGPAVLHDAVFGERAEIASGYVKGAVLLAGAKLGANAHVREGTLLEEEASTAHAVGLKQTVLLSFVTLGSLINFCDALMAGGTSRSDHAEVGSGFIHFNFTPWGTSGDKATPSLFGDVVDGVFLDQARIFLGGAGGAVGPRRVGFGAITAAGNVVRKDVAADQLVSEPAPTLQRPSRGPSKSRVATVREPNAAFVGELAALRAWYREVRIGRLGDAAPAAVRIPAAAAVPVIDACIAERLKRLGALVDEHGGAWRAPAIAAEPPCPIALRREPAEHVAWVRSVTPDERAALRGWLGEIAADVGARVAAAAGG
jgi:UDP-N-acetylglucosamine/UDP-N-acetylgalactosamine diphosphorylase